MRLAEENTWHIFIYKIKQSFILPVTSTRIFANQAEKRISTTKVILYEKFTSGLRRDHVAVRREGDGRDRTRLPLESLAWLSHGSITEPHCHLVRGRCDRLAVRRKATDETQPECPSTLVNIAWRGFRATDDRAAMF